MTLIELLVSIAILSIMILIFSSILADSQKVVAVSQDVMHANAKAAAIAQIIRNDIGRITQNGFLCITQTAEPIPADRTALLLFTTAGVSPSALGTDVGSGMIVCYGQGNNQACDPTSANSTDDVIWRQAWILKSGGTGADVYGFDLADIQIKDRDWCQLEVVNLVGFVPHDTNAGDSRALIIPPRTPADLAGAWQSLAANCSDLEIAWTDGTTNTDGDLNWFGKDNPQATWESVPFNEYDPTQREYDHAGRYRILWTHHTTQVPPEMPITWAPDTPYNWPRAIRIRFVLTDDSVPPELGDTELGETVYEVICPIGM